MREGVTVGVSDYCSILSYISEGEKGEIDKVELEQLQLVMI